MTVLFRDAVFQRHLTGRHPEAPARLAAIDRRLDERKLPNRCRTGFVRAASLDEIARLHEPDYIAAIRQFCEAGGGRLEVDTVCSPQSFDVASRAVGAAIDAVNAVLTSDDHTALCLVRPPGHHALAAHAMGFCLFNTVALAAEHALRVHDLERVLIVDWDVHHGNATQDAFYRRGDVGFFSVHRYPFYPGTGSREETGEGDGLGTKFNLPVAFGTPRREYLSQFETMLNDAAKRTQPQLVLVSAGFDAHSLDPVGSLGLETEDFETLTRMVQSVANDYCGGRLVSALEGGYHVDALADSVALHLETLLDAKEPRTNQEPRTK